MTKKGKPFSYLVKVGHISANPVNVKLEADENERAALAQAWNVTAVESFSADLTVSRWKRDGVRVSGRVTAEVVQPCVVTLEPVTSPIDEDYEVVFVPENSRLARVETAEDGEIVIDPEGPDIPETFTGDSIDVGRVTAEFAALAIDPYPRKEGVEFTPPETGADADEKAPSPFAVLRGLKDTDD